MAKATQGAEPTSPRSKYVSYWDSFKEWLVPSITFSKSESPKSDLTFARILVGIFYIILTGVFIYTFVRLCWSGRIELFSNLYKVDFVEAPSLAFCPFHANQSIGWPAGHWVEAIKHDLTGSHTLRVAASECEFDRKCGCVDMSKFQLKDTAPETSFEGHHAMVFRESMEINTNFSDPSPDRVLKVGIYDSFDTAPDWFYVDQGTLFIGQLELIIWTVIDISVTALQKMVDGDLRAMGKNRHIYRYTSEEVGRSRAVQKDTFRPTSIRYEMKTYFVEETMSSHRAFSLYTVGVLIALIALRWVVVDAFYMATMPEWQEKQTAEEPTIRELTATSRWIRNLMCCCLKDKDADGQPKESDPLLERREAPA